MKEEKIFGVGIRIPSFFREEKYLGKKKDLYAFKPNNKWLHYVLWNICDTEATKDSLNS